MPILSSLSLTRRGIALTAAAAALSVAGAAAAGAVPQHPAAARGPVHKPIVFTCGFPLIGKKPVKSDVAITFPDNAKVGEPIQPTDFSVGATIDGDTTSALKMVGAATVEGDAATDVDVKLNETDLGVTLNGLVIPSTPVPDSGEATMKITGPIPGLTVKQPGKVSFAVGQKFTGKVTPKKADGSPTELGTFDLVCTQDAGQDPALSTVQVS